MTCSERNDAMLAYCVLRGGLWWVFVYGWWIVLSALAYAACGEAVEDLRRDLTVEEQGIRTTEQMVRTAVATTRIRDAALRKVLTNPPANYDQTLARHIIELRRSVVEPKREELERLREQYEESRRQWELGHRRLSIQLTEARAAFQTKTISQEQYCLVREEYVQGLRLYLQGIHGYLTGMEFYARALDAYGERFLKPYTQGFTDPKQWQALIRQLEGGNFLQDILVPMAENALRSRPPEGRL
jgi:hypothetical protein